ncbi:methyltransferase domain-containing protein [Accumulibacter sp.]|uniref:methyltransferase domain-containing protein n=1 Tax=Accumulibacter sp. TaxID=2053492 RepID=UPI0025F9BA4B|nr:methyltransferase domain-containing protein [Accumulibacter sp.]MCM8613959.1 methyltransferase domain-containing protein [Accumulibacter sp.]MCM8637778.1 methyltransferase domain-containing protein [Accumulibacter sp.]MCM8638811.1 methyltransferase domain-containing protein [Accumulibacter sp.]
MLMLRTARVTPAELVHDLGAGEGRIPIAAAPAFGARAVGIEYSPEIAALARRNARRAGLDGRMTIVTGAPFVADFSVATPHFDYVRPDGTPASVTVTATADGRRLVGQQEHPQATGSVRGERH